MLKGLAFQSPIERDRGDVQVKEGKMWGTKLSSLDGKLVPEEVSSQKLKILDILRYEAAYQKLCEKVAVT
ncbi:hypothetical protein GF325_13355 [Candidatus Bathyarchaeota archaeon]|nr:hypothetical protein [Candidatus Bathyarchaeota archaeon]